MPFREKICASCHNGAKHIRKDASRQNAEFLNVTGGTYNYH